MGIPSELMHYWGQKTSTNRNLNHNHYDINNCNGRSLLIASPAEEQRILQSRLCTQEGVRAGIKAAAITCVVTAVPTILCVLADGFCHFRRNGRFSAGNGLLDFLSFQAPLVAKDLSKAHLVAKDLSKAPLLTAVRVIPWAKANLNHTAQALIISGASIAAYFITVDKTILECARRNAHYNKKD
ncbi:hypothetical protein DKX38_029181 [Salix brachista]|uniref:Early nodulin-93-like n=1 Tax=Salix brachista TaxID=2182728 RepID=A0A5N5J4B2_9ROSI|nr:hypothetical protein DKX38_029181 [Salix brachista]